MMNTSSVCVRFGGVTLAFCVLLLSSENLLSQTPQEARPDKYALLIGVTDYAKPELNTGLKFPESDAKALGKLLKESGFKVDLLLGNQATRSAIEKKLQSFSQKGLNQGVVFVGLCGHGTEFSESKKSYFCPYDTAMKATRDRENRTLYDETGKPLMAFVEESMIAIDDVLLALGESMAAHRILVADCCRDDPNRARGRSFGSSLTTDRLPIQTLMLLGCSSQEQSLEHDSWGHGALTKCLLDQIRDSRLTGRTMGSIAEEVIPAVKQLVTTTQGFHKQTPRMLSTGRVELLLTKPAKDFKSDFTSIRQLIFRRQPGKWDSQIELLILQMRRNGCDDLELDFLECLFHSNKKKKATERSIAIRDKLNRSNPLSYFAIAATVVCETTKNTKSSSVLKLKGTLLESQLNSLIELSPTYDYTLEAAAQILSWSDSPDQKRYSQFLDDYIAMSPQSPNGWMEKGNNVQGSDPAAALEYFAKAIELDPQYSTAFNIRGHCYILQEKYEEAIKDFDQAILIEGGGYANAHMQKSRSQLALGREDAAKSTLEYCLENCETSYFDLLYAAGLYRNLKNKADALKILEKAIATDATNLEAYQEMVTMYIEEKNFREANRTLKRAVTRCDKSEASLLHAKTHLMSFGLRAAFDSIKIVRNLSPENVEGIQYDLILSSLINDKERSLKCIEILSASPEFADTESALKASWVENKRKVKVTVPPNQTGALYLLTGNGQVKVEPGSSIDIMPGIVAADVLQSDTNLDGNTKPRKSICYFSGNNTTLEEEEWIVAVLDSQEAITFVYEKTGDTGSWIAKE